jgi:hypothetical protein
MDIHPDPSIAALHAYWDRQRGAAAAPLRSAIAPVEIAPLLGDVFILDAVASRALPFRLAGTRLCAAFGRELRDTGFLDLWAPNDEDRVTEALHAVTDDAAAATITVAAANARGQSLSAALLLLPMRQSGHRIDRILGLFAPQERTSWLGLHPILKLGVVMTSTFQSPPPQVSLERSEKAVPVRQSVPQPDTDDMRPRPRLVVLEGGRR